MSRTLRRHADLARELSGEPDPLLRQMLHATETTRAGRRVTDRPRPPCAECGTDYPNPHREGCPHRRGGPR